MAAQQSFHAYAQPNKGALMPGQTISVNKYTVQVERYLSQGGFAQVYLVRTQTPVYNTTHHVLKHVVVANESMLTEVKKEVDVMRLLRGHPNIVYLIDAAWAKMPTGAFEVYILMEYCSGGGIIDMMNRRLRERLTEAEILQIFVEVCEGVAHMHNSRPPLLHRDLKVENILQSSTTLFKLCDFGSTATVSKPPTTSQEIRAVEADLNRHTTLQYRAPEMIDLHSRRPIDEKSDVWALGVLLYKLCYYTTPFEEHGPLAILNVQYRFPAYPVYSQQMMHLISSMLREHGSQRPTSFEVLAHVHNLRGTKTAYSYPLPTPTPLSPRPIEIKSDPLDGVVTYRQPAIPSSSHAQATKIAELTVPQERRGRPKPTVREAASPSPSLPNKPTAHAGAGNIKLIDDTDFDADGNAAWSSAIAKHISMGNQGAVAADEAWKIQSAPGVDKIAKSPVPNTGFNDDFTQNLWTSTASNTNRLALPITSPRPQSYSPKIGPLPQIPLGPHISTLKAKPDSQVLAGKERDAFEGLGLMTPISKPVPTLGEARKLRTGLAIMSTNVNRPIKPSPSPRLRPKAHTPRVSPIPTSRPLEPDSPAWSSLKPSPRQGNSSAETRFPSLEELDATFSGSSPSNRPNNFKQEKGAPEPPSLPPRPAKVGNTATEAGPRSGANSLKPLLPNNGSGVRSEHVTGTAMRDTKEEYHRRPTEADLLSLGKRDEQQRDVRDSSGPPKLDVFNLSRSQFSGQRPQPIIGSGNASNTQRMASAGYNTHVNRSRDLLTGDDELDLPRQMFDSSKLGHDMFKIRDSPSKRASIIEQSDILEATVPQQGHAPTPPTKESVVHSGRAPSMIPESPTVSRFIKAFPALDISTAATQPASGLTGNWDVGASSASRDTNRKGLKGPTADPSSSEDEGPEEPTATSSISANGGVESQPKRKGRQSSVHDLVDLWGGAVSKEKQPEPLSSSLPFKPSSNATKSKPTHVLPPRPSSPPRKSAGLASAFQSDLPSPRHEQPQPSPDDTPSPSSKFSRTRPQSMFIFPSRSTDGSSPSSAALQVPPEDTRSRPGRRTSISDMVQRFESIQASAKANGSATSPSPNSMVKPVSPSARDHLFDSPSSRPSKPSLEKIAVALPGLSSTSSGSGDPIKRKPPLKAPSPRPALTPQRTSPTTSSSVSRPTDEAENIPPRQRNTSVFRSEATNLATPTRRPVLSVEEITKQSQLEAPVSTTSANNDRPSSPERPYQGVGKLIDQWQRKSAEAEASRNAILSKRTSLAPPKRVGLVPNNGKGL